MDWLMQCDGTVFPPGGVEIGVFFERLYRGFDGEGLIGDAEAFTLLELILMLLQPAREPGHIHFYQCGRVW